ncbi:ssDNA/dsDNA binding protein [Alphaentomopoxvirus acuprea]|uniref:SsDNA/dsDNA binding protein n=1 Tax=Alphaentomopoxvirus acuprea TaxID=62099 RepID=W6JLG7_9POXV|nr:ssDNA/dsDNA binding protein [Anomala cuprea entomopoxvirus]BAO49456.1 ssDNA/dsDNA binding protein [Anomala cuprea entomopoxvirus]
MYESPATTISNYDLYSSRYVNLIDMFAGAASSSDKKSILRIIGKTFIKDSSIYPYIHYDKSIKDIILYNIYDLRDYIKDNPEFTIQNFTNSLGTLKNRIMLLSGDTKFKCRYPNRTIFCDTSYPILITYTLNDDINIVIENPVDKIDKYQLSNDMAYIYKQQDTYVMSIDKDMTNIIKYYEIYKQDNKIMLSEISDISMPITPKDSYEPLLLKDIGPAIHDIIAPTIFNFDDYISNKNEELVKSNKKKK